MNFYHIIPCLAQMSVCLSVCHTLIFCQNTLIQHQNSFTLVSPILVFLELNSILKFRSMVTVNRVVKHSRVIEVTCAMEVLIP